MDVLDRYASIVDDPTSFSEACRTSLPTVVRVNTLKSDVPQTTAALSEAGIDWDFVPWHEQLITLDTDRPGRTLPYYLGWIHGQEEVSALPPLILNPDPGDRVLDACAAPGSKTSQLSAIMQDEGVVVANDVNTGRLSALRANAERLGITNIAVTNQDARTYSFKPFDFNNFDGILVDAPCSGEGTIRKNPGVLAEWSEDFVTGISSLQRDLLRRAVQATKPGGTIVYSTCTFAPEENEAILDHVLSHEDCRIVKTSIPIESNPGITGWRDTTFDPMVQYAHRIYPHQNDTGGFFFAKLEVSS